jgi:hypothetical protein
MRDYTLPLTARWSYRPVSVPPRSDVQPATAFAHDGSMPKRAPEVETSGHARLHDGRVRRIAEGSNLSLCGGGLESMPHATLIDSRDIAKPSRSRLVALTRQNPR